jgi:hypothetical protein
VKVRFDAVLLTNLISRTAAAVSPERTRHQRALPHCRSC